MKKILFGLILVTIYNLAAFAQTTPQVYAVKSDNGIIVVYNNKANTFAFEIVGKDIKPQNFNSEIMLFLVDGKVFQANFPKLKNVLGSKIIKDEKEILKAHQKWEIDFQSDQVFKQKLTAENEDTIFLNLEKGKSKQTFFWTYKRPAGNTTNQFVGDAFQSTLIGDRIMVVGSPLTPNQDLRERRQFFNGTLSSLVFFDKELTPGSANKPSPATPKTKTTKTKGKN